MNLPAWFGPDDTQVAVIIFYILVAFTTESDFLFRYQDVPGLDIQVTFGQFACIALCIIEFFWVVLAALNNLYKARKEEHFKKVYAGNYYVMCHWGFMIIICTIFMIYATCTPVMHNYTRLA